MPAIAGFSYFDAKKQFFTARNPGSNNISQVPNGKITFTLSTE